MVINCDTCLAASSNDYEAFEGKFCGSDSDIVKLACKPKFPESGHTLGPWVRICFTDEPGGNPLTVGNKSSPAYPHKAIIKSFEFGHSEGLTVRVVIQDQHGGTFETFFEHLFKDWKVSATGASTMQFQFGWVKSGCETPHPDAISPCYNAIMTSLETNFSEGKFTVEITGRDMGYIMPEGGYNGLLGGDGQEGDCLKDAVVKMMTNTVAPNYSSARFVKAIGNEQYIEAGFQYCDAGCSCSNPLPDVVPEDDPEDVRPTINRGLKGKWPGHGQDKLQVAMRWLQRHSSSNRRSWVPINNPSPSKGKSEILFKEDTTPKCYAKGDGYWNPYCVGTYVVNGGRQSPVLEFNPKVEWRFGQLTSVGGDLSTTTSVPYTENEGSVSPGRNECPELNAVAQPGAGHMAQVTGNENSKNFHGENATREDQKSIDEALRVHQGTLNRSKVEADLVVVGDPTLVQPMFARQSTVHIIFINPYFIDHPNGQVEDARWQIGSEPCNSVLTNIAWRIKSITHKIELGNYTTIINIWLTDPGTQIAPDQQLGGWTGGWRPPSGP